MATLTSSTTVSIGSGSAVVETASIPVVATPAYPGGTGRLIHPTLGTLDYDYAPDEWVNIDTDVVIPPIWSTAKTLTGASSALWPGHLRDVEVKEIWHQSLNIKPAFMRQLLAFWTTPPDPDTDSPVLWYPNYVTANGYQVAITDVTIAGDTSSSGITLNPDVLFRDWVSGAVTITMRILGRA